MASAVEICLAQEAKLKDTQVKENAVRFNPTTYQFERWTGSAWTAIGSNIDESNLVHKTGNEMISGTKTFGNTIVGSVSGNSGTSSKLATARTLQTNLTSTSTASFDGTANVTLGVTGILPVANGGTGNSTGKASSAVNADSAVMAESAVRDGAGNTIADTYIKTVNNKAPSDGNVDVPARNVGDEWHSFTGKIPAGGVPYCGQTVARATYADLWNYVQAQGLVKTESEWQSLNTSRNGNVPYYSSGDGSTTFRMPKIVGYIKGAASTDGVGAYTVEGLPNITGTIKRESNDYYQLGGEITNSTDYTTILSGAFNGSTYGTSYGIGDSNDVSIRQLSKIDFDASKSNTIYGNSSHVTPETITILFGVYAYGELTVTGSTTTDALATGLATLETRMENALLPVGSVVAFAANSVPDGYLICNGAEVSRETYANLFSVIATLYGEGDGINTFNLPNLTNRFLEGSSTAGNVLEAGLPNISGQFDAVCGNKAVFTVPFTSGTQYQGLISYGATDGFGGRPIYFNASKSNSIYGTSTTVQPPALTMRYYIKY